MGESVIGRNRELRVGERFFGSVPADFRGGGTAVSLMRVHRLSTARRAGSGPEGAWVSARVAALPSTCGLSL